MVDQPPVETEVMSNLDQRPLVRAARFASDRWPQLVTILGTIGIAVVSVMIGNQMPSDAVTEHWWQARENQLWIALALLIVITLIGGIVAIAQEPTVNSLRSSIAEHKVKLVRCSEQAREAINQAQQDASSMAQGYLEILDYQLSILANYALGFGDTERISVYKHDDGMFRLLGRYSKNPDYQKRGRPTYPDNQGCIGAAWRNGESIVEELPDPSTDPRAYSGCLHKDWDIPLEVSSGFRMRSRSLAAFAIEDLQDRRIAVIVFESTRTDVLAYDRLREVVKSTENRRLTAFIDKMKPFEAVPGLAQERGF